MSYSGGGGGMQINIAYNLHTTGLFFPLQVLGYRKESVPAVFIGDLSNVYIQGENSKMGFYLIFINVPFS